MMGIVDDVSSAGANPDPVRGSGEVSAGSDPATGADPALTPAGSRAVTITYCTQCNWLLRAAWMAQELLSTFSTELTGLTLVPGTGGVFTVTAGSVEVWNRATDGGFPEITELKRRVRDQVAPDRPLGHADRAAARATAASPSSSPSSSPSESSAGPAPSAGTGTDPS